jgi:hypothetical protein
MDNLDLLNIEDEIRLKRFDPKILISYFEKYFKSIDAQYPTSLWEAIKYRRRSKKFFKVFEKYISAMDAITQLIKAYLKKFQKYMYLHQTGKPTEKLEKDLAEIDNEISKKVAQIENFTYEKKEFQQLILIHADFRYRLNITMKALIYLISSNLTLVFIGMFAFASSFFISYYVEDPASDVLRPLGLFMSKLIPALIIFITVDKSLEWMIKRMLWEHVKRMYAKMRLIQLQT